MDYKKLSSNPICVLLELVGAKWKILIIKELLKKEMRFSELKKKLGCTAKVLTTCLRELEEDGIVIREIEEGNKLKVEYYLADLGYTMKPVIDEIQKWGTQYKKYRKLKERL